MATRRTSKKPGRLTMATGRTSKKSGRKMPVRRRDPVSQNDIYEVLKRSGAELDHHESDLYVRATPETLRLTRGQPNVSYFISNGQRWIELPFRYTPFWKAKSRDFTPPRKRSRSERTDHRRQWVATFQELWSRHGGAPLLGERQWKEPLALYKQGQSPYSAYQTIVKKHFPGGRFTEDNRGRIPRKKRRDPSKVADLGAFREKKQAERRAVVSRELQEYEHREVMSFLNDLRKVEKAPLRDRKEDVQTFTEILHSNPEFVAESVGDILSGNYGHGAKLKAQQVAHSPRMNQAAALVQWAAALNWRVPQRMAIAAWKTLSQAQRKQLDALVKREIKDNLEA